MYKTVIFDFDGTIADTFSVFYSILRELGPEIGIKELTPEDILEYRQKGAQKLIKEFKIKAWRVPFLVRRGQKMFGEHIENTDPFDEMPEILRLLFERKIKLGIITTNAKSNVERFLDKHDLRVFDFVISAPSLFGKKRAIKRCLRRYRLEKQEVLYVGDEVRDVQSAKAAGVVSGAVVWGYNDKEVLEKARPDYVFEAPQEIIQTINEENQKQNSLLES
jgi:phosphoglycolate phosphatase